MKAQKKPHLLTAFAMDAPTEKQFDLPVQERKARDTVKALEGCRRWMSKITGVMISGIGMLAYVSRDGLGSGGDLSCTILYLALLGMIKAGREIGMTFKVLLDNTAADNKNNEVIAFMAWLVLTDKVTEAGFFCMMVDHTYCKIDQSFSCLIAHLLSRSLYVVADLLAALAKYIEQGKYNCLGVHEIHCVWNWKEYFAPHLHQRFTGFCTGRFGSGMHEFVLRKDSYGTVRLWFRKSAQADTWLPDAEGYPVFKSIPTGEPELKPAKPDSKWCRAEVQETIRSWFRYMILQPAELANVKKIWESRFESLPVDGDMSTLPPGLRLEWAELPSNGTIRGVRVRQHTHAHAHVLAHAHNTRTRTRMCSRTHTSSHPHVLLCVAAYRMARSPFKCVAKSRGESGHRPRSDCC